MITGQTLRDAILSGANNIANQRTRVDELNVFPVPDGDTGTNMSLTMSAAAAALHGRTPSAVGAAADTAADQCIHAMRLKKSSQSPMAAAVGGHHPVSYTHLTLPTN